MKNTRRQSKLKQQGLGGWEGWTTKQRAQNISMNNSVSHGDS